MACHQSKTSKQRNFMHLLCCFTFIEAQVDHFLPLKYVNTIGTTFILSLSGASGQQASLPGTISSPGPSTIPPGRLDLSNLAPSVQQYFQEGIAPSTQWSYRTAMKQFHHFLQQIQCHKPLTRFRALAMLFFFLPS